MMKPRLHPSTTASILAVVALACTMPVAAQRVSVADRIAILEQRAADTNAAASSANIETINKINALQREVREIRGQVEALQQQNEQLKSTLRSQSLDLDERLQALEQAAEPAPMVVGPDEDVYDHTDGQGALPMQAAATEASSPPPQERRSDDAADPAPDPAEERSRYESAFEALKSNRYPEAKRLFQAFLQTFSEGAYAANAHYWLGESYYLVEDYANAREQFEALITRWPDHNKSPSALLKIGLSQYGQKQHDAAEATLQEVGRRYPGTDAARIATDRLRTIQLSRLN